MKKPVTEGAKALIREWIEWHRQRIAYLESLLGEKDV